PLNLNKRKVSPDVAIKVFYSQLPDAVAKRLANSAASVLNNSKICCAEVKIEKKEAACPGCSVFVFADYNSCVAGFSSLGARGKPAEQVGAEAAKRFLEFNAGGACVDEHLADQLLLYTALAKGKSSFTVEKVSQHFKTNVWAIAKFLEKKIAVKENAVTVG
ncbi:MAG: RNA 3'-terminal phosphate cyclase, partial [Candidatus Micrarchaeota archaeon]